MEDLFGVLSMNDVIAPVAQHIQSGSFTLTDDGKIVSKRQRTPYRRWQMFYPEAERECARWNEIYHQYYRIVPRACRHCWKVVCKVDNLALLFRLVKVMQGMGLESKCGVDGRRAYGGYGQCVGFWYAPLSGGLAGGRNLFKSVRSHLEAELGSEGWSLLLKRGCTEMEAMLPSDRWDEHSEEFDRVERLLDQVWVVPDAAKNELEVQVLHTHRNWILWRAELGDPTYRLFTGGNNLFHETVTYHESIHAERDYRGLDAPRLIEGVDDELDH